MEWTRTGLEREGFIGFCTWAALERKMIPTGPGVYVVLRNGRLPRKFLATSTGGWFKGKNPTVSPEMLADAWLDEAEVLYIGKATSLQDRLWSYRRFGAGSAASHWGGRYIWHLADSTDLLVGWKPTPVANPREIERQLIADFAMVHGRRPFANMAD